MKTHSTQFDVAILGAGPYGLSIAAHMQKKGLKTAVFGKPMYLWKNHMPKGMQLRSRWWASSLSDPEKKFSIAEYFKQKKQKPYDPLTIQDFILYGLWFQKNAVPDIDETYISSIEKLEGYFLISLIDGRKIKSANVVMAPGLGYYIYKPLEFADVPKDYISHTCDNYEFDLFKGKRVVIVGGGQSALENAALMSEAGIDVHLIHRKPLEWLAPPTKQTLWQAMRYPKAGIADGWDHWGLEHFPYIFQMFPRSVKNNYINGKGKNGPAGSHWLIPRTRNVTFHKQQIEKIEKKNNDVLVKLSNKKSILADHIILATGYKVNINKLPMLHENIKTNIQTYNGSPELNNYFESSIPGLYFCGISSYLSFGPLFRFVVGTDAAAKRIAHAVTR